MNFEEINKILGEKCEFNVDKLDSLSIINYPKELGNIKHITEVRGEGEGSTYYTVILFEDHNVYIRWDGYYSSYHGVDYSDWDSAVSEVTPQEKIITVYE